MPSGKHVLKAARESSTWLRGRLYLSPILLPASAAISAIWVADQASGGGWTLCVIFLLLSLLVSKACFIGSLALSLSLGALHTHRLQEQAAVKHACGSHLTAELTLTSPLERRHQHWQATGRVRSGPHKGQSTLLLFSQHEAFQPGDIVNLSGRLELPPPARNPDVFDQASYLHRRGIATLLRVHQHSVLNKYDYRQWPARLAQQARQSVRERLTIGMDSESSAAAVTRAVFLGEKPPRTSPITEDYTYSGTLHVFAVSGLHVMMIGSIIGLTLRLLGAPMKLWVPVVIIGMISYAAITGMRPPALRAALMGSLFLIGLLLYRRANLANLIACTALIALLLDSHMLFRPGFQLSFGVLLSILLTHRWWATRFRAISYMDPFLPRALYTKTQTTNWWLRKRFAGSLTLACSAWCGSAPLMWWHFGLLTPIGVLASVPLVFLVFSQMALSCLVLAVGCLSPSVASHLNQATALTASLSHHTAALFADIPASHTKRAPWQHDEQVVIYDTPKGGGACYMGIGGGVMLDAGGTNAFYSQILPSLRKRGARIDSIIASHADANHSGGLPHLIDHFPIKQAVLPDSHARSSPYQALLEQCAHKQLSLITPSTSDTFTLNTDSHIEVIYAPPAVQNHGVADNRCLVLMLHWRGKRLLFLNDSGYLFEQWASQHVPELQADIVITGKHTNDLPVSAEWISQTGAHTVITTHSPYPSNQLRSPHWLAKLEELDVEVLRQNRTGAIYLRLENGKIEISSHLGASTKP